MLPILLLLLVMVMPGCCLADSCSEYTWTHVEAADGLNVSAGLQLSTSNTSSDSCTKLCHQLEDCCAFSHSRTSEECSLYSELPGPHDLAAASASPGTVLLAKGALGMCGCAPSLKSASVTYPDPGTPPFPPGTRAAFTCDPDFTFIGLARTATCDVTGAWTPLNGSCVRNSGIRFEQSVTWDVGLCLEVVMIPAESFTLEFTQGDRRALTLGLTKSSNGTLLLAQFTYEIEIWDKGELIGQQLVTVTPGQEVNVTVVALETSAEIILNGQSFQVDENAGLPFSSAEAVSVGPFPLLQVSFRCH